MRLRFDTRVLLPLLLLSAVLLLRSSSRTKHLGTLHQTEAWRSATDAADEIWASARDAVAAAAASATGENSSPDTSAISSAVEGFRASTAALHVGVRQLDADFGALCLVSKWNSVWLVHANRTRSFVQSPARGCVERAASIEDGLELLPKAHAGQGLHFMSATDSAAACNLPPCRLQGDLPRRPTAPSPANPVRSGAPVSATPTARSLPPAAAAPNGTGAWMDGSALTFNDAARARFATLRLRRGEPLLVVFGGASVNDMLLNWAYHVKRLSLPFVVACMDEKLFSLANGFGLPGVMLKRNGADEQRVSTRWKYYRMDPKAFLNMGLLKVRFFVEFLRAGFELLCSDLDVVWLNAPMAWIDGSIESAAMLAHADVVVSVDATGNFTEGDGPAWGVHNEMNTGMILLRPTAGAMALCAAWMRRMEQEVEKVSKLSSNFVQWWTNDQTFFNEVLHRAPTLAASPKAKLPRDRASAAELMHAPDKASADALEALMAKVGRAHESANASYLRTLRNVVFKKLACAGAACASADTIVAITTFPYTHFASGHTYFTQSLQKRMGFEPVAVHTTFQFGDTPEFTWGKRNRLRERQLWAVDDASYYERSGPGTHAEEAKYRGYVTVSGELVEAAMLDVLRTESDASIKIEGAAAYSDRMRARTLAVGEVESHNPNRRAGHLLLDAFQRRLVINLVALGRALKRKVVMPRMTCWCDRYWWLLENCRFPGVSAEAHPMPFHCPFDHLYDLEKWVHSDVPMREYSFLANPRVRAEDRRDVVRVRVDGARREDGAAAASERSVTLPAGANYKAVADAVVARGWQDAFVVQVHARSLELLCEDLGSAEDNGQFNKIMHTVLGVAEQIRYCDRKANPFFDGLRGGYDQNRNPINCTWGFHRPPPLASKPACKTDVDAILAERRLRAPLSWREQANAGIFSAYNGKQVWSTNNGVADLYRQFI